MPFGIGSSKKPKDKGNVIQSGKYLLYTTVYQWSTFSILKIDVKNCSHAWFLSADNAQNPKYNTIKKGKIQRVIIVIFYVRKF